ncbi:MAG: hypothetical protein OXB86_07280 [Bdellovibrionales bacterium]|nr:hypothetical protein [Bdellovibrionales bacterium]
MKKTYLTAVIFLISCLCYKGNVEAATQPHPSFVIIFDALETGDRKTFQKELKRLLLQGSFKEFVDVMTSATPSGETIFHGFATVKKNKKGFAQDLQTLLQLLSFPMREVPKPNSYTLAGVRISISNLEEKTITQAFLAGDLLSVALELDKLKKGSAIDALSVIHGKTSSGKTFYGLIEDIFKAFTSQNKWEEVLSEINEAQTTFINLPFQENNEGLKPIEMADKKRNKRIYKVFQNKHTLQKNNTPRKLVKTTVGFLSAALAAWWITDFDVYELLTVVTSGTFGVVVGDKCYNGFQKLRSGRKGN